MNCPAGTRSQPGRDTITSGSRLTPDQGGALYISAGGSPYIRAGVGGRQCLTSAPSRPRSRLSRVSEDRPSRPSRHKDGCISLLVVARTGSTITGNRLQPSLSALAVTGQIRPRKVSPHLDMSGRSRSRRGRRRRRRPLDRCTHPTDVPARPACPHRTTRPIGWPLRRPRARRRRRTTRRSRPGPPRRRPPARGRGS